MLEYLILALSFIAFGDAAFIPAVYLAVTGHLNLYLVMLVSFIVSNTSDVVWYMIGTKGLERVFKSLPFVAKWEERHPDLLDLFKKHQLKIVFWSRFLHGSGVSIMILSGIYRVPFKKYMLMNILSSLIVITAIPLVIYYGHEGASSIFHNIRLGEWVLAGVVVIIVALSQFEAKDLVTRFLLGKKKDGPS